MALLRRYRRRTLVFLKHVLKRGTRSAARIKTVHNASSTQTERCQAPQVVLSEGGRRQTTTGMKPPSRKILRRTGYVTNVPLAWFTWHWTSVQFNCGKKWRESDATAGFTLFTAIPEVFGLDEIWFGFALKVCAISLMESDELDWRKKWIHLFTLLIDETGDILSLERENTWNCQWRVITHT